MRTLKLGARDLVVVALAAFACSFASGCSSSSAQPPATDDAGAPVGCTNDPRVTPFALGLQAKSGTGALVVSIVSATPAPPHRGAGDSGMNSWKVNLSFNGAPPPDGTITVSTFMPDHGHSSPLVPTIAPNGDGTYTVNPLYFFMGGVWQITFGAGAAEGGLAAETATFSLCVP